MAGGYLGGPLGAAAGTVLGGGISRISGFGDYQVRSNSLSLLGTSSSEVPQFVSNSMNNVRIKHREFLGDVTSPGSAFSGTRYRINPGATETFPWLASFAAKFQLYKLHGMVFQFKSTSSEYATGAALGAVVIATNYTPSDTAFLSKSDMENTGFCVSAKPSLSIIHAVECDPSQSTMQYKYIRDPLNSVPDANTFDWGVTTVATSGLSASSGTTIGELWVSYDIELIRPVSNSAVPSVPAWTVGNGLVSFPTNTTVAYCPMGVPANLNMSYPMGYAANLPASAFVDTSTWDFNTPAAIVVDTANTRTAFPRIGTYVFNVTISGAGTQFSTNQAAWATAAVGCTVTTNRTASTAGDLTWQVFKVVVTAPTNSVTWTRSSLWTSMNTVLCTFSIES